MYDFDAKRTVYDYSTQIGQLDRVIRPTVGAWTIRVPRSGMLFDRNVERIYCSTCGKR